MASLSKVPLCYYNLGLTCSNSLKLTCLNVSSRTALNEYGSLTARSAIKKEIEFKILVITKNFPVDSDVGSIQAHDESWIVDSMFFGSSTEGLYPGSSEYSFFHSSISVLIL